MSKQGITKHKKKLAVLELERLELAQLNESLGKLSEHIFLESLKKDENIRSVKKLGWKILKIITQEGEYIPVKPCNVILVSYENSRQRKKTSKHELFLAPK